jgi:hypothetical protein
VRYSREGLVYSKLVFFFKKKKQATLAVITIGAAVEGRKMFNSSGYRGNRYGMFSKAKKNICMIINRSDSQYNSYRKYPLKYKKDKIKL